MTVTFDGQPPLVLPNLATYTSDRALVVATPPRLPELPGSGPVTDLFSSGHGAWVSTGGETADAQFVFLVSAENGSLASTNTVRARLQLDGTDAYTGEFTLDIIDLAGTQVASSSGTLGGARITVEPVSVGEAPAVGTPAP